MRRSMHSDSFSKKRRAKIVIAHLRVMERFLRRKKANHQVTCLTLQRRSISVTGCVTHQPPARRTQ